MGGAAAPASAPGTRSPRRLGSAGSGVRAEIVDREPNSRLSCQLPGIAWRCRGRQEVRGPGLLAVRPARAPRWARTGSVRIEPARPSARHHCDTDVAGHPGITCNRVAGVLAPGSKGRTPTTSPVRVGEIADALLRSPDRVAWPIRYHTRRRQPGALSDPPHQGLARRRSQVRPRR